MRQRLFWKMLFAFWLTLFCMVEGLWFAFVLQSGMPSPDKWQAERVAPPVLALLGHALERDGPAGYAAALPAADRRAVGVAPATRPARRPAGAGAIAREATAPDGRRFRLSYRYGPPLHLGDLPIPWQLLTASNLGGLLFSGFMAWYLTRPVKLMRDGFGRLAAGDFDVRLQARVGWRRDVIANLAEDFDRMAARLGQLIGARDRLLHDISHELRSPLSRLQLAIGLARQDPRRLAASLGQIENEARKLETMVGELLILARAESGATPADEYFDPIAALEQVFADARFEAQADEVRVAFAAPALAEEQRPPIRGSAELFRRAVENIVRNALRFLPRGAR